MANAQTCFKLGTVITQSTRNFKGSTVVQFRVSPYTQIWVIRNTVFLSHISEISQYKVLQTLQEVLNYVIFYLQGRHMLLLV